MLENCFMTMFYISVGSIVILALCKLYSKLERKSVCKKYPVLLQVIPEKVQTFALRNIYAPHLVNVPLNPDEPVTFNKNVKVLESSENGATVYTDGSLYRDDIVYFTDADVKYAICYDGYGNFEVRTTN